MLEIILLILFYVVFEVVFEVFKGLGVCVNVFKVFVLMIDVKGDLFKEEIELIFVLLKE